MSTLQTGPATTHRSIGQAAALPTLPQPAGRSPVAARGVGNLLVVVLVLTVIAAAFLVPFVWMISTSLKSDAEIRNHPTRVVPSPPRWENYLTVLDVRRNLGKFDAALATRNTLLIAVLTVVGTTLSSALVAYGFAKVDFKGRGLLFGMMLATMMIPFPVTMVTLFGIWRWLGDHTGIQFLGTYKPLWLPAWFGSAFNIFLLRQFFMTIPKELSEAARIDGCSEFGIFWRVVLPLARPALTVVALFSFMAVWNDYMGPLVYVQRPEQYTLALSLQAFQGQHSGTEWNLIMAASVLVIVPVILLFFLAQRTFIQGIATTGLK